MEDFYKLQSQLIKFKTLLNHFLSEGIYDEVQKAKLAIEHIEGRLEKECQKYQIYRGLTENETETNIYNATLDCIRNNDEFIDFVLEELDAAYEGSDYSRSVVKTCGIDPDNFRGRFNPNNK